MIRLLIIIFSLFIQAKVYAGTSKLVNPQFSYQYSPAESSGFNLPLYQLILYFEERGFSRLSAFANGNIPYLHVDEVLSSNRDEGLIFINANLKASQEVQNKIVEFRQNNGVFYLYHTKKASIAFFNLSENAVKKLVYSLDQKAEFITKIKNFFISESYADTVACNTPPPNKYGQVENISSAMDNSFIMKKIGECAVHALHGAKESVEETADFFKKLATNPAALWTDVKKSYDGLKHFAMNFSTELQSFYQTITNLTLEDKIDIACTLTGQLIPGLVLSLTGSSPMVGAKLLAGLLPKLERMRTLINLLQRYKISTKVAKESLSCAI